MRMGSFRQLPRTAALCLLLASPAVAPADTRPRAAGPDERRAVTAMLTQFRRARGDSERRAEIVETAAENGPAYVAAVHEAIERELRPQLTRYRNAFQQQAAGLSKDRAAHVDLQEVLALRRQVLALQHQPGLSKDLIVQQGEPALERLREIFVVSREDVLEASAALQADRAQLGEAGALWERCAAYLHEQLPDDENKPEAPPSFEGYLAGEESMAAGLAAPMDPQTRKVLTMNNRLAARLEPEEARAVLALNLTRNLLGLSALVIDPRLCAAARDHSQDMQTHQFFAHESPVPGKATPRERAQRFGTTASGENIAMGHRDGQAVNMAWFRSPGHHRNMLGNHTRVGIGQVGAYFTQLFGK